MSNNQNLPSKRPPRGVSRQVKRARSAPKRRTRKATPKKRYRLAFRARLLLLALFLLLVFGVSSCTKALFFGQTDAPAQSDNAKTEEKANTTATDSFASKLLSESAILINADTGEVLYQKNPDKPLKPASLVKLMTAYTAFDLTGDRLNDKVAVPEEAFDVDMGKELGKRLGVEFDFQPQDWDSIVSSLVTKRIDMIISGMNMEDDRIDAVNFVPYGLSDQVIIVKKDYPDLDKLKTIDDYKAKVLGTQLGGTAATELL